MKLSIFGFPLSIERTAWFMVGFILLSRASSGPQALVDGLIWVFLGYGSILAHELGHAQMARSLGLGPVAITLHGMGGMAQYTRRPSSKQGLLVSVSGPAVNLLIAILSLVLMLFVSIPSERLRELLETLLIANVFWTALNLLPMLPLDGGKIALHGLSVLGVSERRGAAVVVTLSAILALALAAGGLYIKAWFLVLFAFLSLRDIYQPLRAIYRF